MDADTNAGSRRASGSGNGSSPGEGRRRGLPPTVRLDRMLAEAGTGTRREVRALVKQGRVTVNGATERDPGRPVRPGVDQVVLDGRPVASGPAGPVSLMLNKPAGVITATRDEVARTVLDLLPAGLARRVVPAGRLDKDTEGLLILTEDGQLCHRLISPRHGVEKEYWVQLDGELDPRLVDAFAAGVRLDDGYVTLPARLMVERPEPPATARVVVTEGKYHQIKRMFAAFGLRVTALRRLRIGSLWLDPALGPGEFRPLRQEETELLLSNPAERPAGP